MSRWMFPFMAIAILGMALFPARFAMLLGVGESEVIQAETNETQIMILVPGVT